MAENKLYPIFDGHNDALMDYIPAGKSEISTFFERNSDGRQLDLPRAKEGGFGGGFFAVYISSEHEEGAGLLDLVQSGQLPTDVSEPIGHDYAQRMAMAMSANLFRIEAASNGQFKVVRTADEVATCLRDGVMAAILHFEGAEQIDTDLYALEVFYKAGLRSLGIVHSRHNDFGFGVPFQFGRSPDTGPGLTDAGKELVRACNRLGILIDLSHLNEKGFWDVASLTDVPLVATHSNAHALCQSPRNLTDKQLDAIKESDGMVGLNFFIGFLREDGKINAGTPVETAVRHVDYLVERLGIDRVGLGADYGWLIPAPEGMPDVSGYPKLVDALRKAGYDDEALRKITHENWIRVLRKTWK